MNIAILAWGSLIWDKRELKISSDWSKDGIKLPIEFSRISQDGRLTLVIDEDYGTLVDTYWAISRSSGIEESIEDLRQREGTINKRIGFLDLKNKKKNSHLSEGLIDRIEQWANDRNLSAVIWTDLPSNFKEKQGVVFSIDNAISYLESLEGEIKEKADKYIEESPTQIKTNLKVKLNNASA
ncbi:MAG: hypothetical protein ACUZ8I_02235 [Candidatus Scalindua sp.]